jgi:hypothetical protein
MKYKPLWGGKGSFYNRKSVQDEMIVKLCLLGAYMHRRQRVQLQLNGLAKNNNITIEM